MLRSDQTELRNSKVNVGGGGCGGQTLKTALALAEDGALQEQSLSILLERDFTEKPYLGITLVL